VRHREIVWGLASIAFVGVLLSSPKARGGPAGCDWPKTHAERLSLQVRSISVDGVVLAPDDPRFVAMTGGTYFLESGCTPDSLAGKLADPDGTTGDWAWKRIGP
jgi:hypothetical protein